MLLFRNTNIIHIQPEQTRNQASLNYTSPTFNGCPKSLSIFFPPSCSFLLDFIRWPLPVLVSCFQITLLPKGQALLYHLLCLSSTLVCFLSSWGPKSLSFYLPLQSSSLFLFFAHSWHPLKNHKISWGWCAAKKTWSTNSIHNYMQLGPIITVEWGCC